MAIDQLLLESIEHRPQPILRFYGWSVPTLSLGYFQRVDDRHGHSPSGTLKMVRRATGGGAIVHHHELTYSLVMPIDSRSPGANQRLYVDVHRAIIHALREHSIRPATVGDRGGCQVQGGSKEQECPFLCFMRRSDQDLILNGYKILGSAQRKSRFGILQHGSLLMRSSPHAPELPGVANLIGRTPTVDKLSNSICMQFRRHLALNLVEQPLTELEHDRADAIAESRFRSESWIGRR